MVSRFEKPSKSDFYLDKRGIVSNMRMQIQTGENPKVDMSVNGGYRFILKPIGNKGSAI